MIEIKCPRCEQYWYDEDDAEGGRVRLCSRCVDELRPERGHRAEIDIPFLICVGVVLLFDLLMIALTALMPGVVARGAAILGLIMTVVGTYTFQYLGGGWHDTDWRTTRWGLLIGMSGFALFGFSVARIAR